MTNSSFGARSSFVDAPLDCFPNRASFEQEHNFLSRWGHGGVHTQAEGRPISLVELDDLEGDIGESSERHTFGHDPSELRLEDEEWARAFESGRGQAFEEINLDG